MLLILVNIVFSMPICTNNQKTSICYYKGPLSRSIIVTNMESSPIFFNATIIKDNIHRLYNIKNVELGAYKKFMIEEKFYFKNKNVKDENLKAIFTYSKNNTSGKKYIYKNDYEIIGKIGNRYKLTKKVLSRTELVMVNKNIVKKSEPRKIKKFIFEENNPILAKDNIPKKIESSKINKVKIEKQVINKDHKLDNQKINEMLNKDFNKVIKNQNKIKQVVKQKHIKKEKPITNNSQTLKIIKVVFLIIGIVVFVIMLIIMFNKNKSRDDELEKIEKFNKGIK